MYMHNDYNGMVFNKLSPEVTFITLAILMLCGDWSCLCSPVAEAPNYCAGHRSWVFKINQLAS